ncbi:MAG: acetyl-CoA carboxylase, carboxyltransferase subunit beta [Planctomycetes bacterium]|nr:acetyl-CoA carboxylase, carboxyltransferase subunit beta [Planctomycetota bacterium]
MSDPIIETNADQGRTGASPASGLPADHVRQTALGNGEGGELPGGSSTGGAESSPEGGRRRRDLPANLWMQCPDCSKLIYKPKVEEKLSVCPECNYHFEITSAQRVETILDEGSFEERFAELSPLDPLEFRAVKAYKDRLATAQRNTGLRDGCVTGVGTIEGTRVVFGVSDSRFLRGSMGSVVGEKICRATELARDEHLPFIFVSGSGGGARMDEGIFSLMQMAKTSAALADLNRHKGLFISVLTNPTMGGAMASFAALGDIVLAEPKSLIGFAGPNVIRQTIKSEIPDGFQTSEFLLEHGFLDGIVDRENLRSTLSYFLRMFKQQR